MGSAGRVSIITTAEERPTVVPKAIANKYKVSVSLFRARAGTERPMVGLERWLTTKKAYSDNYLDKITENRYLNKYSYMNDVHSLSFHNSPGVKMR